MIYILLQGLRDGKRCVTADWLSDILLKQQLVPPFFALHVPVPFKYVFNIYSIYNSGKRSYIEIFCGTMSYAVSVMNDPVVNLSCLLQVLKVKNETV